MALDGKEVVPSRATKSWYQGPELRQHAMRCKARKDLNTHRIEGTWGERIEQRADLIVTGNPLHS